MGLVQVRKPPRELHQLQYLILKRKLEMGDGRAHYLWFRYIAICQKDETAMCVIHDTQTKRIKKSLQSSEYQSKEFVSVVFSPVSPDKHLITLTGEPDWQVIFWEWNSLKIQAMCPIGVTGPTSGICQVSYSPHNPDNFVVTGHDTYKFFELDGENIEAKHSQLNKKDPDLSTEYTCHTWTSDGLLLVCTAAGEIIVCESTGEYKCVVPDSPLQGFRIECIAGFVKGFIVAGDNGQIFIYEKTEDLDDPFKKMKYLQNKEGTIPGLEAAAIRSAVVTTTEDQIYFVLENNQLMNLSISLDGTEEESKFDYVMYNFHSASVTGLDVCIRKQLIVTCSLDKSVRVWNYVNKSLDICEYQTDQCYAVAFHPSGFHLVVALTDKILMMNVFSKTLRMFKSIAVKQCREIKFSNGGHLFAAINTNTINIYNFWTGENPTDQQFKGHQNKVRCVNWDDDDQGFQSAGIDGAIYEWNLHDSSTRKGEYLQKSTSFLCVVKKSNSNTMFGVGTDRSIKDISESKEHNSIKTKSQLSQIVMPKNEKVVIVGTCEPTKPGFVSIYKLPFELVSDVQAHSLPIERMRLSYCNNFLFTTGQDGCLIIYGVKDVDPRGIKREKEGGTSFDYSEEILTLKTELEEFQSTKDGLITENGQLQGGDGVNNMIQLKKLEEKFQKTSEDLTMNSIQENTKYDALASEKQARESFFEGKIKQL